MAVAHIVDLFFFGDQFATNELRSIIGDRGLPPVMAGRRSGPGPRRNGWARF